jgi:hypothetical protein
MKAASIFMVSFAVGAVGGIVLASICLYAMAGFPNRSGGGSWDIGPVVFPVMAAPAYLLAHPIIYAAFQGRSSATQRATLAAFLAAVLYALVVWAVARAQGYHG